MTTEFTPLAGLAGGTLIGLSAVLLMLGSGRIAGNSGIFSGLFAMPPTTDTIWRAAFRHIPSSLPMISGLWLPRSQSLN